MGGLSRSGLGGSPRERGNAPRKGMGSAGLDVGTLPRPPRTRTGPPRKGGSGGLDWGGILWEGKGNWGGSEGQDMGDPPRKGFSLADMGEHRGPGGTPRTQRHPPEKEVPLGGDTPGKGGLVGLRRSGQGVLPGTGVLSWPGAGGDTLGWKGEPQEGSAGLDMGGPPERGAHLARTWGDIPGRKRGAQLGGTCGPPLRKGGSPGRDWGGHPGGGDMEDPPGKGRVCFVWTRGDTPQQWGPAGQDWDPPRKGGAQLSWPSQGGTPGNGGAQERGFSFPGRRRTRTRVCHRGSRSS